MMTRHLRRATFVAIMVAFCVGFLLLCHWQVERLAWKQQILVQFDQIERSPVTTPLDFAALETVTPVHPVAGTLSGKIDLCRTVFITSKVNNDVVGKHILAPLATHFGDIMVDFGWVPLNTPLPSCAPHKQTVQIRGVAAIFRANRFMPVGEVSPHHRVQPDFAGMAAPVLFLALSSNPDVKQVQAVPPTIAGLRPRNDHLQYALFWAAMAVLTAMMTIVYLRSKD